MDGDEFRRKLRAAWHFLHDELNIARSVSTLYSLKIDDEFNAVALDPESEYKHIYLKAVSRSYYNFLLNDYSIYQFSWSDRYSWRFAYLPNPWIAGVPAAAERIQEWEYLESLGAYDQEEMALLISEMPYYGSIPAIRFEYSVEQYRELAHPAAHFHIGRHADNRWASAKHLNPLTFVMAIMHLTYRDDLA